jgi:NAD(P)-dependent dehydrogenase (short-subunit alcohol dehydrogenase family)
MRFKPADLPDLTGKTAIVTGANSGIGWHTANELARHGAGVVLACRNVALAEQAAARIEGVVRVEELDLASLDSVRAFAEAWDEPLDLLINNAGVMTPPHYRETADGHELQFGTNHLGPFALTGRLLPALLATATPRVVTVSSIAHHDGRPKVLEQNPREGYRPHAYYGNSKLANLLFGLELQRRATAAGSALTSTMAHPGVSNTNLFTSRDGRGEHFVVRTFAPYVMPLVLQSAARGADSTLYAATLADPGSYTGPTGRMEIRGPIGPANLSKHARDQQLAVQLWELSERETGVGFRFQ